MRSLARAFPASQQRLLRVARVPARVFASSPAVPAGRRVVVTGIGFVSPLGTGVDEVFSRLLTPDIGVATVTDPAITSLKLPVTVAASAPLPPADCPALPQRLRSQLSRFEIFAVAAAADAVADAALPELTEEEKDRAGVAVGSGIGCVEETAAAGRALMDPAKGPRRLSVYSLPKMLANLAAGQISIAHGFRGPNHCASTACTTGAHAVGDAYRFIKYGDADIMLAGGAEAGVSPLSLALFSRIGALTRCPDPSVASRPFASARDGFVMGEGAAVLVLEEESRARARGARVYAEVAGYGLSGDAHHITSPPPDGRGASACMRAALRNAGVAPSEVDYVNAHATSTPLGDSAEANALRSVFHPHFTGPAGDAEGNEAAPALPPPSGPLVSSTKGSVGHMLGAAGAFEAAVTALAVYTDRIPLTSGTASGLDPSFGDLRVATADTLPAHAAARAAEQQAGELKVRWALSNSFAFGGSNASVLFKKYDAAT